MPFVTCVSVFNVKPFITVIYAKIFSTHNTHRVPYTQVSQTKTNLHTYRHTLAHAPTQIPKIHSWGDTQAKTANTALCIGMYADTFAHA